ncbi:MAG TPA: hypothetical protein VKT32_04435, partial [Chthonomonadaceae bacterium]|nr:hypothetical protein [Chthonomonadaceae bacterium]
AWFVGYTGDLATAVWVAREHRIKTPAADGGARMQTAYLPMPGETGGQLCAPIWRDFMARAVPIEQRVNLIHGRQPAPVQAPSTAQMLASLEQAQEQQQAAQAQQEMPGDFAPSGWSAQGDNGPAPWTPDTNGTPGAAASAPPGDGSGAQGFSIENTSALGSPGSDSTPTG